MVPLKEAQGNVLANLSLQIPLASQKVTTFSSESYLLAKDTFGRNFVIVYVATSDHTQITTMSPWRK